MLKYKHMQTTQSLDQMKANIDGIFNRRLLNIPNDIKKEFPDILKAENTHQITYYAENRYLLIAFFYAKELERINQFLNNNHHPFPGLISEDAKNPGAFKLQDSRNILIENCTISNTFSFSNCKDSTILLKNHEQNITTNEINQLNYKIDLAFIVFLGKNINNENLLENLENLTTFAVNKWSSKIG